MYPPRPSFTLTEAIAKMEGYCAYQDRCHMEVDRKLREMGMIPQAIDHIMVHLIKNDHLNEERFASSFARGKFNIKKWGRNRIIQELKQRQISRFNIDRALKELDPETYINTFNDLAQKRFESLREKDIQKKRKKLADYLLYRGWETPMVYEKVLELIK
ncbi:MAG: regulatory protein RecX [Sediminicola sp.]|tara:strand:- start:111681 stop:112157 length:477 start_codon:yes stop_codon:yes gene_type:complete